jgi:hypothetical protein
VRRIELATWQVEIVERFPREFLRGLIHSDGCRVLNRVNGRTIRATSSTKSRTTSAGSSATRAAGYDVEYTLSKWKTVSIGRADSAALLDSFVGPKV